MLNFYYIDNTYIQYLRTYDKKIPEMGYNSHDKFICGVVLQIKGMNYYAPISSNKTVYRTSYAIKYRENILGTIRFSFMFPADDNLIKMVNFNEIYKEDSAYAELLRTEWRHCIAHEDIILRKAMSVYSIGRNKNHKLNYTCCDFKVLEDAYQQWLSNRNDAAQIDDKVNALKQLVGIISDMNMDKDAIKQERLDVCDENDESATNK